MITLAEKINHEYQCFFLDQMRTSKENIFAHASEIEIKKQIKENLLSMEEQIDPVTIEFLLAQSNVLESAYCYIVDTADKETTFRHKLKKWFLFLQSA